MEDQASTTDKDMMGTDEYLDASHGLDFDHEGAHDADMIDDVAEPTMADADDHYNEADYTVEMQDGTERTYEAEMLEDDYDEDIDAPAIEATEAPSEKVQPKEAERPDNSEDHAIIEPNNNEPAAELPPNQEVEPVEQHEHNIPQDPEQHDEQHVEKSEESTNQQPDVATAGSPPPARSPHEPVEPLQEATSAETGEREENVDESQPAQTQEDEFVEPQPQADIGEEPQPHAETGQEEVAEAEREVKDDDRKENVGEELVAELQEEEAHASDAKAVEHLPKPESSVAERAPLYPVKVYYQENEISLFPPREGDSSEMFFLEDEGLAYGPFDKLFASCHAVLHEHIGDGEVLVIDVEALNIQLTEDSIHTSKVTLSEIVDLYLRLCHNDGVNEPEALYLTLSTKLTISAEMSDLLVAANEGKGLSEIQSSIGYAEADDDFTGIQDGSYEEFNPDHTQQYSSEPEDDYDSELDQAHEAESVPQAQGATEDQKVEQVEQDREDQVHPVSNHNDAAEASSGNVLEGGDAVDGSGHEENLVEAEPTDSGDQQQPNEESYDSEENSESTATVTQLPETEWADEQEIADKSTDVVDGQVSHDPELEYHDAEGDDDEAYHGEETNVDAIDFGEAEGDDVHHDAEEAEEAAGDFYGDVAEPIAEESNEGALPEIEDEPQPEDATTHADPHEHEDVDGEALQGDGSDETPTKPAPNGVSQDIPEIRTQLASELENDSLGITEDLLKSPSKDSKPVDDETNTDEDEPGEIHEDDEHAPSLDEAHEDVEELNFDDEEYLDLGIPEGLGAADEDNFAKSPSRAPAKRHREVEDDFELTEIPTPDAKRSRSS
ncbi:hypothetical protein BO70DRAFT_349998 [Aspergillus heteromorphus CBS 117.55]|uniref:Uncharacterized protein n=1 Tax=Aspergillus heteromorphus CBS 117.55 TaxID=1448321 RepID=A0A317WVY8_9EURO|nr:uncharacterized protein BO70DRAFT_349998 [Aspergillus heteromorphus CBS 117.55]PWY90031.1 hypothetical protein BO70DRAFT_349998 [Aspergillus heteromorphus CBS 117.55]